MLDDGKRQTEAIDLDLTFNLRDNLHTYYYATDVPVAILDADGETVEKIGTENAFCKLFQEECGKHCPCKEIHAHAGREADRLKDGYIFSCPSGYVHFAVPYYLSGKLKSIILAGPITLEYPDIDLIDSVIEKYNLSLNIRRKLYGAYSSAPLVEPQRARYLCKLLVSLIMNLASTEDNRFMSRQIEQNVQQAKIGEYIQLLKSDDFYNTPAFDQEQQLIADVISGNKEHAKMLLNEILGNIYFSSGNNLEVIRTRSIELIAILSRSIVENGGDYIEVYQMTDNAIKEITRSDDLTNLSYSLLEILDTFIASAFSKYPAYDSPIVRKAVSYINEHYHENIKLDDVASHLCVNRSYFSDMFKRKMGINFSDYLTDKRITQAGVLLKKSNMSVSEIALAVGYENQSYFSKVFKSHYDMTPKQYRAE